MIVFLDYMFCTPKYLKSHTWAVALGLGLLELLCEVMMVLLLISTFGG